MTAQDARLALQAALATNNATLIAAARQVLATAEDGEDESVDGRKAKKMKKAEEPHEEPDGDEEPEEMEESDDSEDSDDSEAEYGEAEAEEMEEGKAKKGAKKAAASRGDITRLLSALGATTMAQAIGRATAAAEAMAQVDSLSKRLRKLEGDKKAAKLDKLFSAAVRDGRVTRAEIAHLKPLYKGRPLAEAEAYLSAKPRVANPDFARESAAHYPSAPVAGGVNLQSASATKAMAAFGVTAEQVAQRAAERGLSTSFPGGAK